jgi:glucose/arabinose dehydrogenase
MPDSSPSPHFAALGTAFTAGTGLPQVRRMGAFVGEHGGWNCNSLNGYQVVFVPFEYC